MAIFKPTTVPRLKSEILGLRTQIDNLCKAIQALDVAVHESQLDIDPDSRLYKAYLNMINLESVGGNTIEI